MSGISATTATNKILAAVCRCGVQHASVTHPAMAKVPNRTTVQQEKRQREEGGGRPPDIAPIITVLDVGVETWLRDGNDDEMVRHAIDTL